MPYTKPLTEAGKEAERQRKRTAIFREAYGGRKAVAGFKDYEIAALIGCGESTIRRWLKNPDQIPMGVLPRLIQVTGIPVETISRMLEVKQDEQ